MATKKKILVIDAHAMAYRAYFAMQGTPLTHPVTGQPTGAIFSFLRMLLKLLDIYQPEFTAITWDTSGGSFRNQVYKEYKATRKPMPDDLRFQIDEMKEILNKMGFQNLFEVGFEADDLMGTIAKHFGKEQQVILFTGDKDCYQLLTKNVIMLRAQKGASEFQEIDPDWVKNELKVNVEQIPDYMAIVGDTSDNIPGAAGIGPGGAAKLLNQFLSIDEIYKHLTSITPVGIRTKLSASKESVYLSKELATIRDDVPSILKLDLQSVCTPNYTQGETLIYLKNEGYHAIYNELQKKRKKNRSDEPAEDKDSSLSEVPGNIKQANVVADKNWTLIKSVSELAAFVKDITLKVSNKHPLSIDTETTSVQPMSASLVGISLSCIPGSAKYIPVACGNSLFTEHSLPLADAVSLLKPILENEKFPKVGQNIKYDFLVLKNHGITLKGILFDTMIASYLLEPNVRRHNMDDMAFDHFGYETIRYEEVTGTGKKKRSMDEIPPSEICDYACEDADITLQLYGKLSKEIYTSPLKSLFEKYEMALLPVLADMEEAGVAIDKNYFGTLSADYAKKLKSLEKRIYKDAGDTFNINSTKELQKILFEKLNLAKGRKIKTGFSTDQSVLEDLRDAHPVVASLLEHRKYSKLKNTYVDALPLLVNEKTQRIHTSFNQTVAATGRLSSNEPNLQNIPVREETGRAIRRGFIAANGNRLLALDYSQIELRIMAHYSGDVALIEAFTKEHLDIHKRTAASMFAVPESEVTSDQRAHAKVVNFSIIYGVTEFGLAQTLGISREEARNYIVKFFESYPGVKDYMDATVAFAEKNGYVETLSGRRRGIPEIHSQNRFRKEGAKRTAINTPVQGTSADIIKKAMIEIHKTICDKKMKSKMILQVHDELLFDVPPNEEEDILEIAVNKMEGAFKLSVPLKVDVGRGNNWDEAH